jgi:hypothetical protein
LEPKGKVMPNLESEWETIGSGRQGRFAWLRGSVQLQNEAGAATKNGTGARNIASFALKGAIIAAAGSAAVAAVRKQRSGN